MKLQELFPSGSLPTMAKPKSTALVVAQDENTQNEDWVFELDGMAVADSRRVAKVFGKAHKDVLEAINNLINGIYPIVEEAQNDWAEFSAQLKDIKITDLFIEGSYKDRSGKSNKLYYLTKQGFNLAVFGFTGQKALIYKLLFVRRYDDMEAFIKEQLSKPQTLDAAAIATIAAQAATQAVTTMLPAITQAVIQGVAAALPSISKASQPQATTSQYILDDKLAKLPDTMSAIHVQRYLGITHSRAYQLVNSEGFPSTREGIHIRIDKRAFIKWLSTSKLQSIYIG